MGNLRDLERRAKQHGKAGEPPEPEEDELITDKFQRAHYAEFMLRWGGLWLIAMTFFFLRLCWVFVDSITPHTWMVAVIMVGLAGFFMVYLWRLALAARRWVRIVTQMDLQNADRRTIAQRTAELDARERELDEREAAVGIAEKAKVTKAVSKAAQTRAANAKKRAQQVAELAEIARELEEDNGAGSRSGSVGDDDPGSESPPRD